MPDFVGLQLLLRPWAGLYIASDHGRSLARYLLAGARANVGMKVTVERMFSVRWIVGPMSASLFPSGSAQQRYLLLGALPLALKICCVSLKHPVNTWVSPDVIISQMLRAPYLVTHDSNASCLDANSPLSMFLFVSSPLFTGWALSLWVENRGNFGSLRLSRSESSGRDRRDIFWGGKEISKEVDYVDFIDMGPLV